MKQMKTLLTAALCGLFSVSAFAWPDNLFFIGSPFGGEWSLDARSEAFTKDADDPTIFYYDGYIGYPTHEVNDKERGLFKIVDGPAWNGFHPAGSSNYMLSMDDVNKTLQMKTTADYNNGTDPGDTKWGLPADHSMDGWYNIKFTTAPGNRTMTITSFTKAESQFTQGLFLMGGPFVNNGEGTDWLKYNNFVRMERDRDNADLFHFRGYMERAQWGNEPGMFKILTKHGWGTEFHPGESNVALTSYTIGQAQTMTLDGNDTKWELPENGSGNGYWEFTVDPVNKTMTVNSFTHDFDYFTEMYLVGAAMPGGWEAADAVTMTRTSRGVYTWTGTVKAGDFKVIRKKNFSSGCYVANTENEAIVLGTANNLKYERNYMLHGSGNDYKFVIGEADANKEVTITMDLNTMTLLVEEAKNPGTGIDGIEAQLATVYVQGGQLFIDGEAGVDYTAAVYSLDGREVSRAAFTGSTAIALPQGSYVVTLANPVTGRTSTTKVVL